MDFLERKKNQFLTLKANKTPTQAERKKTIKQKYVEYTEMEME